MTMNLTAAAMQGAVDSGRLVAATNQSAVAGSYERVGMRLVSVLDGNYEAFREEPQLPPGPQILEVMCSTNESAFAVCIGV